MAVAKYKVWVGTSVCRSIGADPKNAKFSMEVSPLTSWGGKEEKQIKGRFLHKSTSSRKCFAQCRTSKRQFFSHLDQPPYVDVFPSYDPEQ